MYINCLSLNTSVSEVFKKILKLSLSISLLSLSSHFKVYLPYSPVPVNLQTLAVFLTLVFWERKAFYILAGWIFMGLFGFPVFSGGGGPLYLLGPTGGYIIGFLLAGFFIGRIFSLRNNMLWYVFSLFLAEIIILACGALWILALSGVSWPRAAKIGILPFLYGDSLKIILAVLMARLAKSQKTDRFNSC